VSAPRATTKVVRTFGSLRLTEIPVADAAAASAILVGVDFGLPHFDAELEELGLLAQTAGLQPVARVTCKRKAPDAALFIGSGKAEEIKLLARMHKASEVLFDQALSPAQQRNLERALELPVNDRTMLILTIFSQRARSHEGKLQVELARLQYLPHGLVDAFRATLQEAADADLLLHVIDASNPHHPEQMEEVRRVLTDIGADEVPMLLVFNKLDALTPEQRPLQLADSVEVDGRQIGRVFVSARTGEGMPALRAELARRAEQIAPAQGPDSPGYDEADPRFGTIVR
jgi:50S ribosomal subunit-associated GTPase HflX